MNKLKSLARRPASLVLYLLVRLAALCTVGAFSALVGYILVKGVPYRSPDLFAFEYTSDNASLFPALVNTITITLMALVVAVPLGVFSAIYMV